MSPDRRSFLLPLVVTALALCWYGLTEAVREYRLKRRLGSNYEGPAHD
jgi:hypothetical protein